MFLVSREQEMVVLSIHCLLVRQDMLETGKVGQLFSSVVSRALAEQKVIKDLDS